MLKPTFSAARSLSLQGGVMKAMQRVLDGDVETVVAVISLGLGYGTASRRAPTDLAERVWQTGISDDSGGLGERCITYLRVLLNGGRLPADREPAGDGTDDPQRGV